MTGTSTLIRVTIAVPSVSDPFTDVYASQIYDLLKDTVRESDFTDLQFVQGGGG